MSLLWSSKNFWARSDVVLTDLQTLADRKPEGKAGQFLFRPWALTQRQINFSFTNAQFSSEEPWPKGNPDDTQFYISTSESLTNVFEHLRKTYLQGTRWERDNTRVTEYLGKHEEDMKKWCCFILSQMQPVFPSSPSTEGSGLDPQSHKFQWELAIWLPFEELVLSWQIQNRFLLGGSHHMLQIP